MPSRKSVAGGVEPLDFAAADEAVDRLAEVDNRFNARTYLNEIVDSRRGLAMELRRVTSRRAPWARTRSCPWRAGMVRRF